MKKIKIKARKPVRHVPREAVAIFDKLCAIEAANLHRIPESRGGRKNEANRLKWKLCELMGGIDRWQSDPLWCSTVIPPPWVAANTSKLKAWERGYAARRMLERASRR